MLHSSPRTRSFSFAVVCLLLAAAPSSYPNAFIWGQSVQGIKLGFYPPEREVTVGDRAIVQVVIANDGDTDIECGHIVGRDGGTVAMTATRDGKAAGPPDDPGSGFRSMQSVSIKSGSHLSWTECLNDQMDLSKPGKYTIKMSADIVPVSQNATTNPTSVRLGAKEFTISIVSKK